MGLFGPSQVRDKLLLTPLNQATSSDFRHECTVIENVGRFLEIIKADGADYPELRPAKQMEEIIGMMAKLTEQPSYDKEDSTMQEAAKYVLGVLAKLYAENPERSAYDAMAVLSSAISSVAQKVVEKSENIANEESICDKAHKILFKSEGLASFINEHYKEIASFVSGRTNCPTLPQRSFPITEYLTLTKDPSEKVGVIEIGCGPDGVCGRTLLGLSNLLSVNLFIPSLGLLLRSFLHIQVRYF